MCWKICGIGCVNRTHVSGRDSHNLAHIFSCISVLCLVEWLILAQLSLSDTWRCKNCSVDWVPGLFTAQVLIPDVPKSCFPWCTYFLFSLMYLSPVFPDVPKSCLRCCIIFLFSMMYLIPVWAVGPYFCLAAFLMYLSPVFHDVPTSCFLWCT